MLSCYTCCIVQLYAVYNYPIELAMEYVLHDMLRLIHCKRLTVNGIGYCATYAQIMLPCIQ